MYETFDHTADLGLRIAAPDEASLYVEAAYALRSILIENPESVRPDRTLEIHIDGSDPEYLLFDWLTELLYRFEREQFVFAAVEVTRTPDALAAKVQGETLDRSRHVFSHEVKAITYHQLCIEQTPQGWQAEVIVDI